MKRFTLSYKEADGIPGKVTGFHLSSVLMLVRDILNDGGEITGVVDINKD